jgi:hypothetical protein
MNKIKVRCVKGFGVIGQLHNVEVMKPLFGFGYSKHLYCCEGCGELFVHDLDNPALKGSKELPENLTGSCPNCQMPLKGHLLPYPENVYLSDSIETMDTNSISFDRDHSSVEEFWEI